MHDLFSRLEIVGVQLGLDVSQFIQGSLDLAAAGRCILLSLLSATDPVQTVSVRGFIITFGHVVAVRFRVRFAIVFAGQDVLPLDPLAYDLFSESLVLTPSPGHHADKQTVPGRNLVKVLFGSQFAVRHIDEIDSLQELLQRFVICGMQTVVGLISGVDPVGNRHRSICRHRQPQYELLQIGAMVFVFAVGQQLLDAPTWILSRESHRRGVVVNLGAVKGKDLDRSKS